jgi:hypothetical protein
MWSTSCCVFSLLFLSRQQQTSRRGRAEMPHNMYGALNLSPLKLEQSAYRFDIAAVRRELSVHEKWRISTSRGGASGGPFRFGAPPGFPAEAALAQQHRLQTSVSLPALPQHRQLPLCADSTKRQVGERSAATTVPAAGTPADDRRKSTREQIWRERIQAAEEGRGPDPLSVYCMRKHARRFAPGGLGSQALATAALGPQSDSSAFALANARLCSITNGYPSLRPLPRAVSDLRR